MIKFDEQAVVGAIGAAIENNPGLKRILVAYSGGLDSHVLLHATRRAAGGLDLDTRLEAVHINHQLQSQSGAWKRHCEAVCAQLNVPFLGIDVDASAASGQSPEAAARVARYAAIKKVMSRGDVLLTAHHLEDQAETVLLQMFRGSGVAGLAAMPHCRQLGEGVHLRPFLDTPKQSLFEYARAHDLKWVEDPSNLSARFQRNYLRNTLWPLIESRWPAATVTLSRAAAHSAESSALNAALAAIDSAAVVDIKSRNIDLVALSKLDLARRKNVLRHWLKEFTGRFPSQRILQSIVDTVIHAAADAQPLVVFESFEIRRYRGYLYALVPARRLPPDWSIDWTDTRNALEISALGLTLPVSLLAGIEVGQPGARQVRVRLRRGGESILLPNRPRKSLKALLQESGVAPWRRDRLPLIFLDGTLVAVYGIKND